MTTFLIFGIGSSFGKELVNKLAEEHEVFTVSRKAVDFGLENVFHREVEDYFTEDFTDLFLTLSSKEKLEVLFLNGIAEKNAFFKVSNEEIEDIFRVNVFLPLALTRDIILHRIGRVTKFIFASSSRALHGDEGITIYSASKSSLKGAVASLTKEYARFKQEFYIISLGLFDSGLDTKLSDGVKVKLIQQTAYTELVTPEDVFNCLMYIGVSSVAAGSTISVDHGYLG